MFDEAKPKIGKPLKYNIDKKNQINSQLYNESKTKKHGISEIDESRKSMHLRDQKLSHSLDKLNIGVNYQKVPDIQPKIFSESKGLKQELNLNLCHYIFPFLIIKDTREEQLFKYLQNMNQIRKKFFSFEKLIKTIKEFKILKCLILDSKQLFLFKFSNLSSIKRSKEIEKLRNNNKYDENNFYKIFQEFSNNLNNDSANILDCNNSEKGYEINHGRNLCTETIDKKLHEYLNLYI